MKHNRKKRRTGRKPEENCGLLPKKQVCRQTRQIWVARLKREYWDGKLQIRGMQESELQNFLELP